MVIITNEVICITATHKKKRVKANHFYFGTYAGDDLTNGIFSWKKRNTNQLKLAGLMSAINIHITHTYFYTP